MGPMRFQFVSLAKFSKKIQIIDDPSDKMTSNKNNYMMILVGRSEQVNVNFQHHALVI